MVVELGVLPARCHRQQLLVHLPCLGGGLFDRLGQLGRPCFGRMLRRFQLAPFGPHRLDLGPELLILLPQRGELLLQLSGRGDRFGRLGQLLEALPCGGQRLVQLDERIGGRCSRRAGRLLGVRFGRLLDQDRAGELRLPRQEVASRRARLALPIPTRAAKHGPHQVLANRWARESSRVIPASPTPGTAAHERPPWARA